MSNRRESSVAAKPAGLATAERERRGFDPRTTPHRDSVLSAVLNWLRLQNSRVLAAASVRSEPPAGGGALAARTYGWTGICGPHATVWVETENCGNERPTNPACGRNRVERRRAEACAGAALVAALGP